MTQPKTKPSPQACPQCGKPVSPGTPANACSHCLMALGMNIDPKTPTTDSRSALDEHHIPSVEKLMPVFPHLEIQHLIGHGGMGAVYQARQINLDRTVALKILAPRLACNPAFAERFLREAQTLAKLSHPNIVTVFESGQAGEFYYLVMEFVDGVNLRDTISANLLSTKEALAIVPQVCEALQYAHDQGVIHRDIKPENILIARDGHVRIADFGLAKLLAPTPEQFTLTGTRQVLGTMNYMAPEQIETPDVVDHRADLYSLGVVFYELLTGELPLGRFALPSEKSNGVSSQLDDLVMRTLEKDPNRRYQQASQIKTACQGAASQQPQREHATAANQANRWSSNQGHGDGLNAQAQGQAANQRAYDRDESVALCRPFAVMIENVLAGFANGYGLMHGFHSHLELEFEVRVFMDALKWGAKSVVIPMQRIASISLHKGMLYKYIEVQCDQMSLVDEIPGSRQGMFRVYVKNASLEQAEELVRCVDGRIRGIPVVPSSPINATVSNRAPISPRPPIKGHTAQVTDPQYVADDSEIAYYRNLLKFPRIMLGVAGTLMLLFVAILIFCSWDGLWLGKISTSLQTLQQKLIDILDSVVAVRGIEGSGQRMLDFGSWNPIMLILVPTGMASICFICANRIKHFRDFPFVLISMFILMLPIHPLFILSAPFAVWILFLLLQGNTRRIFRAVEVNRHPFRTPPVVEQQTIVRTIGMFLIFGGIIFFLAIMLMVWIYFAAQSHELQTIEVKEAVLQEQILLHNELETSQMSPAQKTGGKQKVEAEKIESGDESSKPKTDD